MKKKILLFIMMFLVMVISGCSNNSEDKVIKNLNKKIKEMNSYYLSGELSIQNEDDEYNYEVEVYYKEDDYYRVNLLNKLNSHEQIILKNDDGVYVVTPSLNKSFKFQSNWPNDSSQIYLIDAIVRDINDSDERLFEEVDNGYLIEVDANYPNNSKLKKQRIMLDKDSNFKSISVFDDDDTLQMNMVFDEIIFDRDIDNDIFKLENIISDIGKEEIENSSDVSVIDDILYPLYVPSGTVLIEEEKVNKTDGERIILTFDGEKPFILVEETVSVMDEFTIIPVYGEPHLMMDTIAFLANNSITWISDGIEYYLVSDVMSQIELVEIANSITKIDNSK